MINISKPCKTIDFYWGVDGSCQFWPTNQELCWKSHSLGPRYMVLTFDVACRCLQFACDLVDVIHSALHHNYYNVYIYINNSSNNNNKRDIYIIRLAVRICFLRARKLTGPTSLLWTEQSCFKTARCFLKEPRRFIV